MNDKIVIIGTGGFAKEVHEILMNTLGWAEESSRFAGFLDDDENMLGKDFQGSTVLGGLNWLESNQNTKIIIGIGSPSVKRKVVKKIADIGEFEYVSLIDSNAIIGKDVRLGKGVTICAGTILTTNIDVEDFVTINLACTVGHDSVLESYVTVAPGVNISGDCVIKEGVDFGTGATIIQGKEVGHWSIIGAGSVVVKDVPMNTTSVGSPSKVIKEREEGWHE